MDTTTHIHHPHALERLEHRGGPVKTKDILHDKIATRFNSWLAVKITDGVGTMWCAYAFAVLALIGLPAALKPGGEGIIAWIAQTFLQLVLLSIIIVGQNIAAAASDARSENTYKDAEAILGEAIEIQKHLKIQDDQLIAVLKDALSKLPPAAGSTPDAAGPVPATATTATTATDTTTTDTTTTDTTGGVGPGDPSPTA
jgi:hypothetical protein